MTLGVGSMIPQPIRSAFSSKYRMRQTMGIARQNGEQRS
jgi:hypothetical protein